MMYPKIENLYKRESSGPRKGKLILGDYRSDLVKYLAESDWIATEKVDGMNIRVMFSPKEGIHFAGRTDNAQLTCDLVERLQELFKGKESFWEHNPDIILFGEGYGHSIQKGYHYKDTKDFVLFDIWSGKLWYAPEVVEQVAKTTLGCASVPFVIRGPLAKMEGFVTRGLRSYWGDFLAEGVVAQPRIPVYDRFGNRVIVKIKTKDFKVD